MEYSQILINQIFIMFLLIGTGFFLYQKKIIDEVGNTQMTNLILYVIMPCLILDTYQMEYDPYKAKTLLFGFLISVLSMFISILVSFLVKIKSTEKTLPTEQFCVIFTNCGFMAIPLLYALFGQIGVFYCNAYLTVFNFVVWTYGLFLMKPKDEKKVSWKLRLKPFLTPTMLSIFLGLLLYFGRISIPRPLGQAIRFLSSMNTPLAMVVSGVYIARSHLLSALKMPRIYYIVFLKSIIVPAAVLFIFYLFPMDETLRLTILIASACPTASNAMLFANRFKRDVNNASHIFAITTIFSIISLPLVILVAQQLFS